MIATGLAYKPALQIEHYPCDDAKDYGSLRLAREPPDSPKADNEPGFRWMLIDDERSSENPTKQVIHTQSKLHGASLTRIAMRSSQNVQRRPTKAPIIFIAERGNRPDSTSGSPVAMIVNMAGRADRAGHLKMHWLRWDERGGDGRGN